MKKIILLVALLALAVTGSANATNPKHKRHPKPPPVVTPPPVVVPPVVASQVNAVSFCVSSNRGFTYVQLTADGFKPGSYWRGLYDTGATVVIAGQLVTFVPRGDAGIYVAPVVPGVGSTCP